MFNSTKQVKESFFNLFSEAIRIPSGAATIDVPVRYAKKSSTDYVEEQANQVYPCVAIWDYEPTPDERYKIAGNVVYGSFRDTDNDTILDTGTAYYEPMYLQFKFDVGCVAKRFMDLENLSAYMFKRFLYNEFLEFDIIKIGDEEVSKIVSCKITPVTIDRQDGVKENNYEFVFSAMVNIIEPEDVALVQSFNLTVTPTTTPENL